MTKTFFLSLGLIWAVTFPPSEDQVPTWNIDKSHASVSFSVDHFFTSVHGRFKKFDGDIRFDPNKPSESKAVFEIDVKSIDTNEPERDQHLLSEDFFYAEKYPTIKFVSTKIEKKDEHNFIVTGNLTMRGVTKPITFPVHMKGIMDNPWVEGKVIMGIEIKTTINRTEWNVGTGSWAATAVVGDEVDVEISMELDGKKM
ncbi:MAG: YceI family protein [Salibacteraceae bacterium]